MKRIALFTLLAVLYSSFHVRAQMNREQPEALQGVGINEHLGDTVPYQLNLLLAQVTV